MFRKNMLVEIIGGKYNAQRGRIIDIKLDVCQVKLNNGAIEIFEDYELEIIN